MKSENGTFKLGNLKHKRKYERIKWHEYVVDARLNLHILSRNRRGEINQYNLQPSAVVRQSRLRVRYWAHLNILAVRSISPR